jgi:hypothetical protein
VKVNDAFDIVGGLLTIALVAVFFTKQNTATDVNAVGNQFNQALATAESG